MNNVVNSNLVPCIEQTKPEETVSSKYKFISSKEIVNQFAAAGFELNQVQYPRRSKRGEFAAHSMRFRHPGVTALGDLKTEHHPEIIVVNSHDGSHALKIIAGVFRFVCTNGLVVGNTIVNQRIVHIGYKPAQIGAAIDVICQQMPVVQGAIQDMQSLQLTETDRLEFLQRVAARVLDTKVSDTNAVVDITALDRARRTNDTGTDLWSALNRVQENLIRFNNALSYRTSDGKTHTVRRVTGVREQVSVNQMLWNTATEMLKQAA